MYDNQTQDTPDQQPFILNFACEFAGTVEEFEALNGSGQETLLQDG
jgi:hypothetical protein